MTDATLVVSEVFGPTVQGEGPSSGRRAGFVRLGRCNLACRWCDTPYTWDWQRFDPAVELSERFVDDVAAEVTAMSVPLVVITGGEPLIQQHGLAELLDRLTPQHDIEIETAGTIAPEAAVVECTTRFNVSPKLASSGNPAGRRYHPDVLRAFEATGKAIFKFVVTDSSDLDEIATIVEEGGLTDIWLMPEGTDAAAITAGMRALAEPVLERGWNLSGRLHVLLWGDQRGR